MQFGVDFSYHNKNIKINKKALKKIFNLFEIEKNILKVIKYN